MEFDKCLVACISHCVACPGLCPEYPILCSPPFPNPWHLPFVPGSLPFRDTQLGSYWICRLFRPAVSRGGLPWSVLLSSHSALLILCDSFCHFWKFVPSQSCCFTVQLFDSWACVLIRVESRLQGSACPTRHPLTPFNFLAPLQKN